MHTHLHEFEMFDQAILRKEITWWQMDLPSGKVIFGSAKNEMLGYPKDQFRTYQNFTDLVHPDDYEKTMSAMRDHLEGKVKYYETIYRIKSFDNKYHNFFDFGQILKKDPAKTTVIGFVMKIQSLESISDEITSFKKIISGGAVSIIDLFRNLHTIDP